MHIEELNRIAAKLEQAELPIHSHVAKDALAQVEKSIRRAEVAWSGSWLGYHARVYYKELNEPPPEAKFSRDWGLLFGEGVEGPESTGDWCKYRREDVIRTIWQNAGNPNLLAVRQASHAAAKIFKSAKTELQPLVGSIMARHAKQDVLTGLAAKIEELGLLKQDDFVRKWHPRTLPPTRDDVARAEGMQAPPHLQVKAELWAIRHPFMLCGELAKTTRWLANQLIALVRQAEAARRPPPTEPAAPATQRLTGVCIGHGRSGLWREARTHLLGRANLECEDFNLLPIAGITNLGRISDLLGRTKFAILVLAREDEDSTAPRQALLNAVHTAGIFQGRLGMTRCVILVEEGFPEISLINGLPHIRFPAGNIEAAFIELQTLLEQEKVIPT